VIPNTYSDNDSAARSPLSLDAPQQAWVDVTLARLSLEAKIGQLLHPMLTHYDAKIDQEKLIQQVIEFQVGGAFLFCRSFKILRSIVGRVMPHMEVPLLLSGDYEAGANTIEEGTRFGSSMALAAITDIKEAQRLAYQAGVAAALQGAAVGARWTFAPVVDINFNHQNPITNIRSYGDNVGRIEAISTAYIRGLQEHEVAACLKHFPGDGMDARDQHLVTSINPLTLEEWDATYGRTFRAGIRAGVYSVMMGHITMPHLSSKHPKTGLSLPATLDANIQVDLLRKHLGFGGVIISDAIGMGGAYFHAHGEKELVLQNILTGSDMVLFVEDVKGAVEHLKQALNDGTLPEDRLNSAVRNVLSLKAKLGLALPCALPGDSEAEALFRGDEYADAITEVGERCMTLVRDLDDVYPLRLAPGAKIVIYTLPLESTDIPALLVGEQADNPPPQSALHVALQERGYRVASVVEPSGYEREIQDADALIYVSYAGPQAGRGSIRIAQKAHQFLDRARIVSGFPTLFVSFGSPYAIWEFPWVHNFVCGYSRTDNVQKAYARALLGEIPFQGQLPVTLPDLI
jgi:beta-N-acetylhexosaminidase